MTNEKLPLNTYHVVATDTIELSNGHTYIALKTAVLPTDVTEQYLKDHPELFEHLVPVPMIEMSRWEKIQDRFFEYKFRVFEAIEVLRGR